MSERRIRFAIIGCGRIARRHAEHIRNLGMLAAVCDVDPGRAADFGEAYGARVYLDAEEMLRTEADVDVVSVCSPNGLHARHTIAALRAGRHVLCEKPMAEAFMVRHAPQWLAARDLVKKKKIGEVRAIQVMFAYFNRDPKNVRNMADIGGGGLLDIGCYPITVSRFIFDAEPKRVTATIDRDPKFGTDRLAGGLAEFGEGRHLSFTVSTQLAPYQRVNIMGTKGRIEIEIPFNAPPDKPNRYFLQGMEMNQGEWTELPVSDQYQLQAEAFGRVIRKKQKPFWGVEDAIQNMKILDALFRSEKSGKWEKP